MFRRAAPRVTSGAFSSLICAARWNSPKSEFQYAADLNDSTLPKATEEMFKAPHHNENEAQAGYNPWEVLGLKPGVTQHDVRMRYHELLKSCHPDLDANGGNIGRLNQINKAYEIITKSPTLDKRYRNLVTDTQYFYYKFLPEWMAKNVDEMPRYYSWVKWRTPTTFVVVLWLSGAYVVGRMYVAYPFFTTVFLAACLFDVLFHTMIAPATLAMLFFNAVMTAQSHSMAWLMSPKGFLRRDLGY